MRTHILVDIASLHNSFIIIKRSKLMLAVAFNLYNASNTIGN